MHFVHLATQNRSNTMRTSINLLILVLLLLTACATSNETDKQSDCSSDHVMVMNKKTGKYDCVSKQEWEHIYKFFDEENW